MSAPSEYLDANKSYIHRIGVSTGENQEFPIYDYEKMVQFIKNGNKD